MSDSSDTSDILGEREFFVTDIVKTDPPDGSSSGTWYRYTIGHGSSPISGVRAGSLKSVKAYAEEFAENLNQRALLGYSAYAARRLQKK